MRSIKQIHKARFAPIADLITYSPLPSANLDQVDPFLFLNHHGPQTYPENNNGLPFGPHPHRGMETVTFIIDGDIMHQDSTGHKSVITAGGVQWMTAGRGLIHSEISSDEFKQHGGNMEILQLWVNLPARFKMTEPYYKGLQKEDIPSVITDNGKVTVNLMSGDYEGQKAAFHSLSGVTINTIEMKEGGKLQLTIPADHNIFFYMIRGKVTVNGTEAEMLQLVDFNNDGDQLDIEAKADSIILFGHAQPFNEPVVAQGPFVMNTEEDIIQAYNDYRMGKFGTWKE
ncbi:pirin family protein [Polluticoccus soli]|uniref:pirin family protein n=1 Tax=Polluticoccus soli TaxID=3034150 RepID=UPI0023E32AE8|nr:pirin family protein [Flavipsychrobacter sp. JY13-12]